MGARESLVSFVFFLYLGWPCLGLSNPCDADATRLLVICLPDLAELS